MRLDIIGNPLCCGLKLCITGYCASVHIIWPWSISPLEGSALTVIICHFCEYYSPFTRLCGNLTCYQYQLVQYAVSTVTQVRFPTANTFDASVSTPARATGHLWVYPSIATSYRQVSGFRVYLACVQPPSCVWGKERV